MRPDAAPLLADLLSHPSVVLGEIDSATAAQVDQLLVVADVFDALAAHWSTSPGREAGPRSARIQAAYSASTLRLTST